MHQDSVIYEPMLPFGWIGNPPSGSRIPPPVGSSTPASWREVVVDKSLSCGIRVTAERCGLTTYHFDGWPPGIMARRMMTVAESERLNGSAFDSRLAVMNVHQVLLHSAALFHDEGAPVLTRVAQEHLLSWEIDEAEGLGYWRSLRNGPVVDMVTAVEAQRCGSVSAEAFHRSLEWLDDVVKADRVGEFARLAKTWLAVARRDHMAAVFDGWGICEGRIKELQGAAKASANDRIRDLVAAGRIDPTTQGQLTKLREVRNDVTHDQTDPGNESAHDALAVATHMLRVFVPELATSVGGRRLL